MKSKRWGLWILLFTVVFMVMAGGCGGGGGDRSGESYTPSPDPTPGPTPESALAVTPTALSLNVGETGTLTATDYSGTLEWLSEDDSIATVTGSGATATVTAVAAGTADVVVMDESGGDATCRVTVKDAPDPETTPDPGTKPGTGTNPGADPDPGTDPEKETEQFFVIDKDNVLVENAVLQPNVYEVPKENFLSLSFAEEENRNLAIAPEQAVVSGTGRAYQIGDVLVAPPSDKTAYGFAAVVESANERDKKFSFGTS